MHYLHAVMKKVLIIAYRFPPNPAVGALRPAGLTKYLPEFGWEATVLTSTPSGNTEEQYNVIHTRQRRSLPLRLGKILFNLDTDRALMTQIAQLKNRLNIRSKKSLLDLLLVAVGEVTAYPDPQKGWRRYAVEAGREFLGQQQADAMISTSSPVTSHIVAGELKARFKIPWIADFRDLWTRNYYYPYSHIRRRIETRLELRTLSTADAMVAISRPIADELKKLHGDRQVYSIPNGFDPSEVNSPAGKLTDRFTITYTGNLYPGKQSPAPFFAALNDLIARGEIQPGDIEVRFYGIEAGWIDTEAKRHGLTGIIKQYGMVPREEALDRQRESQVLLLLKWNDPRQRGTYTAKIFEYLAARRPVLAVGEFPDVVDELLQKTRAGISGQGKEEIKNALLPLYHEYKSTGGIQHTGNEMEINKYSHREMAKQFAAILDGITQTSRP